MTDLATWLLEQIADDERKAAAVDDQSLFDGTGIVRGTYSEGERVSVLRSDVATHIASWDPTRVLAECEAKRRIIRWVNTWPWRPEPPSSVDGLLPALALPYSDRPGYREEWRP